MQAIGRTVTPEAYSAPSMGLGNEQRTDDNMFNVTEVNTKGIATGEILEGLSGSKDVACMKRIIRNLGDPVGSNTKK